MDDWTYPNTNPDTNPDADSPTSQPTLLDQIWGVVEDRLRVAHAEAASQAEADRLAVDIEQARDWDSVDDGQNAMDVPLPFATPPGAALTF